MIVSTLSRLVSAWFAFLLPCYATYKALSRRPFSEGDIQKWSMYWTVIGVFVAFEYLAEWLISWMPFYWELKTIFLLFLSLPQTEGSTYIYNAYLQPFFSRNEADLDAGIVRMQRNILTFSQEKFSALWNWFWALSTRAQSQTQSANPAIPQMSWLLSPDAWRSALNVLQPASSSTNPAARPSLSQGSTGSQSSINSNHEATQKAAQFPVPQHYE
ncbi:hypothetical protein GALMADRAFT_261069 [Galerina marginata CBS 339.88]|uniref:Protein YOP1 n=1 Tax=Galerina marginata (strain CBS 339.88) TaxID=685588 RepID=A0A067TSR9_GALM3|nr:hypothetical protein GALMADRAFT_261069 [Galerina marginata CBS 339.88]